MILAFLALIVLVSFVVGALTGFGTSILFLSIGGLVLEIDELLPVLIPLNAAIYTYLGIRHRRRIDGRLLLRRVLPWMSVGLAIGLVLLTRLEGVPLERPYGVLVVGLALWDLRAAPVEPGSRATGPWFLAAGVMQGLYASGGPPLVQGLQRAGLAKDAFRSSICAIWIANYVFIVATYVGSGRIGPSEATTSAILLPVVVVSIAIGERLHDRIDGRRFRRLVLWLLVAVGVLLAIG